MDYNKIKVIREYCNQIRKFRKLDKFKNLSNESFSNEMKKIFPKFANDDKIIYDMLISGKDIEFLELMFNKIDNINIEYNQRKDEIYKIKDKVEDLRGLIKLNKDMEKKKLMDYLKKTNSEFMNTYPIILNRLLDDETSDLTIEQLFFDEVKHKYEVQIGESLAQKYIFPKVN
tara:strand:- start:253 stop:771 length:519 start_codon:yes stop_codon:yes gene_type:complete